MKKLTILAAVLLLATQGCKSKPAPHIPQPQPRPASASATAMSAPSTNAASDESAAGYAAEIAKMNLTFSFRSAGEGDWGRLRDKVVADLKGGRQETVARYLAAGTDTNRVYGIVERCFVEHCSAALPGESNAALGILRRVAQNKGGLYNRAMVLYAAYALREADPATAKNVLLKEYAAFTMNLENGLALHEDESEGYRLFASQDVSVMLAKFGVEVPPEVDDGSVLKSIIEKGGTDIANAPAGWENPVKRFEKEEPRRLNEAANLLNHKLRELADRKDFAKLRQLAQKPKELTSCYDTCDEFRLMALQCYLETLNSPEPKPPKPEPTTGGGLFGR
jgi:hypothetical protein